MNHPCIRKLIFLLGLIVLSLKSTAQEGFYISDYHTRIEINSEGSLLVNEKIKVYFTEKRRGIFRTIRRQGKFKNHIQEINIDNVEVLDRPFKFSEKNREYEIRIGDKNVYLEGAQEYQIEYMVHNAILNFENHEELFWTLIATEWKVPIQKSSYEIVFPSELDLTSEEVVVYNGRSGSLSNHASVNTEPGRIFGESLKILGKGQGMTIGAKLPKGYIFDEQANLAEKVQSPKPKPKDRAWFLPMALIIALISAYQKWGRTNNFFSQSSYNREEKYYPPQKMTASEVGTYYDFRVNNRDVLAMIPTWGKLGKIIVGREQNESNMFIQKMADLDAGVPEYERYFFDALFREGSYVLVKDLKRKFYSDFAKIKTLLKEYSLKDEYYDQEAKSIFQSFWMIAGGLICLALGAASFAACHWWATGAGLMVLSLCFFAISALEPKKSTLGEILHGQLVAFKSSISNPEDPQLQEIANNDPLYFDNVFPYVVAFGMDKVWLKNFRNIFSKPPDWYHTSGAPYVLFGDFQRDFDLEPVEKNLSIPPVADSGSSSFGGGGGVGGGFGGGGGGSW